MKYWKYILALGAFFVAALALSACGSSVPGNSVATVDGNPVTMRAFDHWMYVAAAGNAEQQPGEPVIVPTDPPAFTGCIKQVRAKIPSLKKTPDKTIQGDCKQLFTQLNGTVMDFLIKAYWYQGEAKRLHISFTPAQIQAAFLKAKTQQFKTDAAFQTFLKESGQTMQDIIFRVRINQIFTKLVAMHSKTVTPQAISAYYQSHLSQFGKPETRDIRIVRTSSLSQANAAKTALDKKQSWDTVAKKYSIDSQTKNNGGLLTGVTEGQEEAALNKAAFAAPANKVEGPIHGTFGYYVFDVTKITKSTQQSLTSATPLIKQVLGNQYQTAGQNAVNQIAAKHWKSLTTCRAAFAMTDCKGFKAPKTSSIPASSATSPAGSSTAPAGSATAPTATAPAGSATAPTTTAPTGSATVPPTTTTPTTGSTTSTTK